MDIYPGAIVYATAGRDKDRFFVVTAVEGDYAFISDGRTRKVDVPKKKKLKHLKGTKLFSEDLRSKLSDNQIISNSMIRKEIQLLISDNKSI